MAVELVVGQNCYFDVTEANQMIEDNFMSTEKEYIEWNKLSDNDKDTIIYRNTKAFEMPIWYKGCKIYNSNPLEWPRNIDSQTVEAPSEVKMGILMNGVRSLLEADANSGDSYHSLINNDIEEFRDGSGASVKFRADAKFLNEYAKLPGNDSIYKDIVTKYFNRWIIVV